MKLTKKELLSKLNDEKLLLRIFCKCGHRYDPNVHKNCPECNNPKHNP